MYQPDFWTQSAEAMELAVEGNRLIAQELAQSVRDAWKRLGRSVVALFGAERQHLPRT